MEENRKRKRNEVDADVRLYSFDPNCISMTDPSTIQSHCRRPVLLGEITSV